MNNFTSVQFLFIVKILFIETTNFSPHLETAFELSLDHLLEGDEVIFKFIGHAVAPNPLLVARSRFIPDFCLPENIGAQLLSSENFYFENIHNLCKIKDFSIPKFNKLSDLKNFKYKDFPVGMSVYSSLVFKFQDPYFEPNAYRNQIVDMIYCAIQIYEFSIAQISSYKPQIVHLFNGRFFENRAILAAAETCKCPYRIHERGASKFKYTSRSWRPHSIQDQRLELYKMISEERSVFNVFRDGNAFFTERRLGVEQNWHTFRKGQDSSLVIRLFPSNCKRRFVYFQSSDDEIMAVSDIIDFGPFESQDNAINNVINIISNNPEWFLVIRLHPNMIGKKNILDRWNALNLPRNVIMVQPDSKLDSYKILESADCTISFNSTMGIESVFWGVPSIVLGPSIFAGSDAVYTARDVQHLEELMSSPRLAVEPKKSHKFGYYLKNYGKEFLYYRPMSLSQGIFQGKNLQQCGVCLLFRKFFHLVNFLKSSLANRKI